LQTRTLNTDQKKDVRLFKSLPFQLYHKNPYWIPPVPGEIEFAMNRQKHPFYAHSDADFIIVESGKQILGRIAVLKNRHFCELHQINTAFFYYYEAVEDGEVAGLLLSAAQDWCRQRKIDHIMGPRGLLRSNCIGMLVEGFDQPFATGMTYNLPYYQDQLTANGFTKRNDHFSGYLEKHLNSKINRVAEKVLAKGHFQLHRFQSVKEMKEWIPRVDEIHHRAFAENPDFVPSTPEEFVVLAKDIIALADPRYIEMIMHGDEIAGFLIAFPNINRGLRFAAGKMLPFGWLWLLLDKRFSRSIDVEGIGLLPEFQGLGGNAVLYAALDRVTSGRRFTHAEIVQIDERNFRSKADMQTMQVVWNKTHRTFEKDL
jgi:hypothetical protein